MKPHWYKIQVRECPVCGNVQEWRDRVYGEKPKSEEDRVEYKQEYDHCERIDL